MDYVVYIWILKLNVLYNWLLFFHKTQPTICLGLLNVAVFSDISLSINKLCILSNPQLQVIWPCTIKIVRQTKKIKELKLIIYLSQVKTNLFIIVDSI